MPTSRRIADKAASRSLAVQSAVVSNSDSPAASLISTTYRFVGLRGGIAELFLVVALARHQRTVSHPAR